MFLFIFFVDSVNDFAMVSSTNNLIDFPVVSNDTLKTITLGDYTLSWVERLDVIDFIFKTKISSSNNVYSSLALSYDKFMVS